MKKILILKFPYSSTFGGGEMHTIHLVKGLMERGFQFYFLGSCDVLLKEFRKRRWYARHRTLGVEPVSVWALMVFTVLLPILVLYLFGLLLYFRFAKGTRVVYCLSLGEKILGTPMMRLLGMKPIWIEHLMIERWLLKNPYRVFYRLWSNLADVVAVSNGVKQGLVKLGVPDSRVHVIYNGVDHEHFKPRPKPKNPTIGYLGRFAPEKGLEDIVEAFGIAVKKEPKLRLVMYGHGPNWEDIRDRIAQLNLGERAVLHKWIDDQREAFQQFSVAVMPAYRRDSFGIVTVETGSMEVPAIVSDMPGFQEVVKDNETGKIFPRRDVQTLSQLMIDVAQHQDKWEQYGKNARQRVVRHFSLDRMLDDYERLFSTN